MKSTLQEKTRLWTPPLVGIALINLILFFGFQMIMPTIPVFLRSLGVGDGGIGWFNGAFTIAALIARPITGVALDRFGRRWIFLGGLLLFFLCTFSYGVFSIVWMLLIVRFFHGIAWGVSSTGANTIASEVIPRARFAEGMGYFTLAGNLSMAAAPAIGFSILASRSYTSVANVAAGLAAMALLIALFLRYRESGQITPARKRRFYEPSSIRPAIVIFFVTLTYGGVTSFIALAALQQGVEGIGIFFTVMALSMLISVPFFARLVDRRGAGVVLLPALLLQGAGLLILSNSTQLWHFLLTALVYGSGFGASMASMQALSLIHAASENLGIANSTFFLGFDSGIGAGSIIFGMVAGLFGYSRMYLFALLPLLIALLFYFLTEKKKGPQPLSEESK